MLCFSGRGGHRPGHPHLRGLPEVLRAGRHRQVHPAQGVGLQQGELQLLGGGGSRGGERRRRRRPRGGAATQHLGAHQEVPRRPSV